MEPEPSRERRISSSLAILIVAGTLCAYLLGAGARSYSHRDVSRYAQMAFEMRHGDTLVPTIRDRPYHEAAPLAAWLPLLVSHVQGEVTPFSSRLFPALAAVLTVVATLLLHARHGTARAALVATMAVGFNALSITYGRASRIDPVLGFAVTAAVAATFHACRAGSPAWHVVAGLALGLGVAAKGPLAAVLFGGAVGPWLAVEWHLGERRPREAVLSLAIATAIAALVTAAWLLPYVRYLGEDETRAFLDQFLMRENVEKFSSGYGKESPPWTYVVEVFPNFAPWILPSVVGLGRTLARPRAASSLERVAAAWFLAALVVFSAAKGKHIRYLVPVLPALAILAGTELDRWLEGGLGARVVTWLVLALGVALAVAAAGGAVAQALLLGPSALAVGLAVVVAVAAAASAAVARRDAVRGLALLYFAASVAIGLVHATVLSAPRLEDHHRYVPFSRALAAAAPATSPIVLIEERPPYDSRALDAGELGLYLGRWVTRCSPQDAPRNGLLLTREALPGRSVMTRLEWPATRKEPPETWYLYGAAQPRTP